MGYNQFSKIVEPRPYTPEIDVNVYGKGLLMNEQNMKNTQQNLNNAADNFLNIQTNIPQDAQVLNQRKQEFQNAVKGLNLSNLNNPQTVSQLNQLITKFSTDPDILGIAQRANKLNKDLKDIKDLEEKGKFVPAWKMKSVLDANEYANSGQYLRDKRFSGQIRAGFDWDKHNKDLISSTPEIEILKKSGGNNDLYKGKTYNALQGKFYEGLKQPGALDDLREQFEYSYGNEDYASHDQQTAIEQVNKLQNIIATSNDPILKQQAINDLEYWKDFSTTVNPQVSKEDAFQRYIRANAEDFARTNTNYALKESKMSDANKMYTEHMYRIQEQDNRAKVANQYKQAAAKSTDPLKKQMIMQAINLGYTTELEDPTQPDGLITVPELVKLGIAKPETAKEKEKEIVREDINSFRETFNKNKDAVKQAISQKVGNDLGIGGFNASDIENLTWNNDTKRYEVDVDDSWYGGNEKISFTQEEIDNLKGIAPQNTGETKYSQDVDGKKIYSEDGGKTWKYKQ